jgi:hypothetical protein
MEAPGNHTASTVTLKPRFFTALEHGRVDELHELVREAPDLIHEAMGTLHSITPIFAACSHGAAVCGGVGLLAGRVTWWRRQRESQ